MIVESADQIRTLVQDGKLEPADAEEVLKFMAFLRNAGERSCTCSKGVAGSDGAILPHAHLSPNTFRYAHGEDVDPEGTEEL